MQTRQILTSDEERIDVLAKRLYGLEGEGRVEMLLTANPDLASQGPFIQAGTRLTVPVIEASPRIIKTVNPWD